MRWTFRAESLKEFYAALQKSPQEFDQFRLLTELVKAELWSKPYWPKSLDRDTLGAVVTHTVGYAQVLEMLDQAELKEKAELVGVSA